MFQDEEPDDEGPGTEGEDENDADVDMDDDDDASFASVDKLDGASIGRNVLLFLCSRSGLCR